MRKVVFLVYLLVWVCSCGDDSPTAINEYNFDDPDEFTPEESTSDTTSIKFLALGDSYTIGQGVSMSENWPNQLTDRLNQGDFGVRVVSPTVIATTGWTTQNLKAAIERENPSSDFDLVSLLIGVNNQFQGQSVEDYPEQFEELLNIAIEKAGGDSDNVIVLSIPDYGFTPFGESNQAFISMEIDEFNQVNRSISESYSVKYFDITPISRNGLEFPDLVASDRLHPSAKQYGLWIELILEDPNLLLDSFD